MNKQQFIELLAISCKMKIQFNTSLQPEEKEILKQCLDELKKLKREV